MCNVLGFWSLKKSDGLAFWPWYKQGFWLTSGFGEIYSLLLNPKSKCLSDYWFIVLVLLCQMSKCWYYRGYQDSGTLVAHRCIAAGAELGSHKVLIDLEVSWTMFLFIRDDSTTLVESFEYVVMCRLGPSKGHRKEDSTLNTKAKMTLW